MIIEYTPIMEDTIMVNGPKMKTQNTKFKILNILTYLLINISNG